MRSNEALAGRLMIAATVLTLAAITTWLVVPARAQGEAKTVYHNSLLKMSQTGKTDWPLHNLDHRNSRYSPLNEINTSNLGKLTVKWSVQADGADNITQITPLVVDGVMYFNSGSKLYAVNAVTGERIWTFQMEPGFPGGGRGPAHGDGKIYAFGPSILYAVDARTGTLVESFGNKGLLRIVNNALNFKYSDKYPPNLDPTSLGYRMTGPSAYFNGTLYVGIALSEGHIPGGLLVAADGTTGKIKWVFNTIPQGPGDEGWEIAKDTWGSGARAGGGIWTTPAIDPELGMVYFNAGNPSPDYDGSARRGINLFTNSTIALNLATGKLAWYYQTIHHDLWDWDLAAGPMLFDVTLGGKTVKGIGAAGKNCFLYLLNRETGRPVNPIVETAVSTKTDVPGEEPWPTQPYPYTSRGVPMVPFCAAYPVLSDPDLAKRAVPMFHPYSVGEAYIAAHGGAHFGGPSFSPRTSLLYVSGKNHAVSFTVKPVGDTLRPGPGSVGHAAVIADEPGLRRGKQVGMTPTETVTAYDPATGEQVWQRELPSTEGLTANGNLVTAGDIVFVGTAPGEFYGFDARSGQQLFKADTKRGIRASPLTYQVNGKQYVAVVATNTIYTFTLP